MSVVIVVVVTGKSRREQIARVWYWMNLVYTPHLNIYAITFLHVCTTKQWHLLISYTPLGILTREE
jgi:hypothetical protein